MYNDLAKAVGSIGDLGEVIELWRGKAEEAVGEVGGVGGHGEGWVAREREAIIEATSESGGEAKEWRPENANGNRRVLERAVNTHSPPLRCRLEYFRGIFVFFIISLKLVDRFLI